MERRTERLMKSAPCWVVGSAIASMLSVGASSSNAQSIDRVETIPIQTASPTAQQFLTGDKNAKQAVIVKILKWD